MTHSRDDHPQGPREGPRRRPDEPDADALRPLPPSFQPRPGRGEHLPRGEEAGKYVYCIVETDERVDLGPTGIGGGHLVYSVHHGGLAAIVSDTPLRLYAPTRENLLAHELVNERMMREHTLIPMSFGTIFRTEADVVALLRTTGSAFGDILRTIRGKVELGLKAVWDRERAAAEIETAHEDVKRLKDEITRTSHGSTYFARMELARLLEAALGERANLIVGDIHATLRPLSVARRANKLIGDNMILNAAYLVDRAREPEFDAAVQDLRDRYEGLVEFKYTGPWPPYNFVNIRLKLERGE